MRQSYLFPPTVKAAPKDAAAVSHKYLVQGGYINQLAAGIWSLLPLGFKVYKKVEQIIREEMTAIDGQEILLPTLQPKEIWVKSGRWDKIEPPLFTLKDQHKKELALGPTHEEVITELARTYIQSYKQLPLAMFQIQNKFRNEIRATGGLLRTREFIMKDLYSFHQDEADLANYYEKVADAYKKIFRRCGLLARMVEASSGSIGGTICHEFAAEAESGEDRIKVCERCGYAANSEEQKGSECPKCGAKLAIKSAIEVGHIFKLGDVYSKKMGANFIDEKGVKKSLVMGCYGIGLGRLVATIAEVNQDKKGIIWPVEVAPFHAHLLVLGKDKKTFSIAENVYDKMTKEGVKILYDDRQDVNAGEKFADADLLGIPYRLVVSDKTGNNIELKGRGEEKVELLDLEGVIKKFT